MKDTERRAAAKNFSEYWTERGYEKGESQPFWLSLLRDVLGVESPEQFITFEEQVRLDHTSFIDGIIPSTHVLIEQKGKGKDLKNQSNSQTGHCLHRFSKRNAILPFYRIHNDLVGLSLVILRNSWFMIWKSQMGNRNKFF